MRRILIAIAMVAGAGLGCEGAEVVFAGTGKAGNWTTDFIVSNPTSAELGVGLTFYLITPFDTGCTVVNCPAKVVQLAPNETQVVEFDDFGPDLLLGSPLQTTYVSTSPDSMPIVRARTRNRVTGDLVDLPAISFCAVGGAGTQQIDFPGINESANVHSNLVISQENDGSVITPDLVVQVSAFDASGVLQASATFALEQGDSLFLLDVLKQLGIARLENGSLRVAKVGGHGTMFGVNAIVEDGHLPVLVPGNPF